MSEYTTADYKIDEELEELIPELLPEDYENLKQSLMINGFKGAPIIVWNGYIVDGHNRYKICKEKNIPFKVEELDLHDKDEVKMWMLETQLGRRNMNKAQKIALAMKYEPIIAEKANKKRLETLKQNGRITDNTVKGKFTKTDETINTRVESAKIAGVSEKTYAAGKTVLNSDNPELKKRMLKGEISVTRAVSILKGKDTKSKETKSNENVQDSDTDYLTKIKQIVDEATEQIEQCLKSLLDKDYLRSEDVITDKIKSSLRTDISNIEEIRNRIASMEVDSHDCNTINII